VYDHVKEFTGTFRDFLQESVSIEGENEERAKIMAQVNVVAMPSCEAHPTLRQCSCPVAMDRPLTALARVKDVLAYRWEKTLLDTDAAFYYDQSRDSAREFKDRMGGQAPEDFAKSHIRKFAARVTPKNEPSLVTVMLTFWASKMEEWR
jgi:hypothetical protein